MSAETILENQKVNRLRLSPLACWILQHAGAGIERGEIIAGFYGLERRYCGFFTDPCFSPKEQRDYDTKYRRVQPLLTKTLHRLERLGLMQLSRCRRYVKEVRLTEKGIMLADTLNNIDRVAGPDA